MQRTFGDDDAAEKSKSGENDGLPGYRIYAILLQAMKRKTTDAVEILKRRAAKDPKLRELYEEEKINLQAALAVRQAREAAGLTQGQLAEKIGTTQSVISRLEDAEYEGHTLKMLERIAEALDQRVVIHLEAKGKKAA
ncbi:MAG: helix-turn-helix transcriptional regulator [Nitrospirota bacterium]